MQVGFGISQKTLERLEWPEILARLAELVRTPQTRARLLAAAADDPPGTSLFVEPEALADLSILDAAEHLHAAFLQRLAVDPAGRLAETLADLARLSLEQRDLARRRVGLRLPRSVTSQDAYVRIHIR